MSPSSRKKRKSSAGNAADVISNKNGWLDQPHLKALGYPIRVQILDTLHTHGEMSPKGLSQALRISLGVVSYHVQVLYKDCELLEQTRKEQRRGAFETFYRLRPDASVSWLLLEDGPSVPLRAFIKQVSNAPALVDHDRADERDVFDWRFLAVDDVGRSEAAEVLAEAFRQVGKISEASRNRIKAAKSHPAELVVAIAALEVAPTEDSKSG